MSFLDVVKKLRDDFQLPGRRRHGCGESEAGGEFVGEVTLGFIFHAACQTIRHFCKGRVVEGGQGCKRGIGRESPRTANLAGGCVKGIEGREGDDAFTVGVDLASLGVFI